jgi:hypothetical protein
LTRYDQKEQLKAFPLGLSSSSEAVSFACYPHATSLSTAYPNEEADLKMVKKATLNNIIYLDEAPLVLRCLRWVPSFLRALILHYPLKRTLYLKTVTCQMQTLSQFLHDYGIGRIDLLKADAEKAELEIFRGIEAQDWPKIQQVVVDVHNLDQRLEARTATSFSTPMRTSAYRGMHGTICGKHWGGPPVLAFCTGTIRPSCQ